MTSTRQVRDYFCHTMQQVENRIGDHTFHELFDTWLNEELAKAWEEGAESAFYNPEIRDLVDYPDDNPYRTGE